MSHHSIIVSGSLAYDRIMNFRGYFKEHIMPEKIHVINVAFVVETFEERFGGTAGNIAYNLALLGHQPLLFSAAGDDFERYRKHFEQCGIDTKHVEIFSDTKTAFANIVTDLDDNQITAFYPGALVGAHALEDIPKECMLAVVAPESKDIMFSRVKLYQEKRVRYLFDPAQQIPAFSGEELRACIEGAYMLIGNDYEISLLEEKTGFGTADFLKNVDILVTTLGMRGSIIQTKTGEKIEIDAIKPKEVVDPTGAGDAYRAGFVAGFLEGKSLENCGKIGSWVAARAIEHCGAQGHHFKPHDVLS